MSANGTHVAGFGCEREKHRVVPQETGSLHALRERESHREQRKMQRPWRRLAHNGRILHNRRSPLASHHVSFSRGRGFCTVRKRNLRHIAIWPRAMTSPLLFFRLAAERTALGKSDGAVMYGLEPTGVSRSKAQRSLGKFDSPAPSSSSTSSPQPRTPSWIFGFVFVFVFCLALPACVAAEWK